MKKYLMGTCVYNEGQKIQRVIRKFNDYDCYDVLIIDDGSTDNALQNTDENSPITIMTNPVKCGAGYCVRQMIDYAKAHQYEAIFLVSGNDKDAPEDVQKLKAAIEEGFDLVQGSRYLSGGGYAGMPLYRKIATRFLHPFLLSVITGRKITDSTNGFRAVRISLCHDSRIKLNQKWLDHYELEPYLFYKALQLGYRVKEVPVTKIYPSKKEGYTKMKPLTGWWSILRPLIYLGLRMRD